MSKGASELPRCCCLLQIPVPPVLLWCPQFTLSPSLHTTAELVFWDLPRAGVPDFWCPVRGILAQKGAALPLFLLWILRYRNLPLNFIVLSKSGWVCAVVRQCADVNVATLTLNFALYKRELKILTVFSNFSISVVHKGRGV